MSSPASLLTTALGLAAMAAGPACAAPGPALPAPVADELPIHAVQGAGHVSPYLGDLVEVRGVVLAVGREAFWVGAPRDAWDDEDATSEALKVAFGRDADAPAAVGDDVSVRGRVAEPRAGGRAENLQVTTLVDAEVTVYASGLPLPEPVRLGEDGRSLPTLVIEDDGFTSFDAETDALDFHESLESMRVSVSGARVVDPTTRHGEIAIVVDDGEGAGLNDRGCLLLRDGDPNPERLLLDDALSPLPAVSVGDRLLDPLVGVMDYSFGAPKLLVTGEVRVESGGLRRERTTLPHGRGDRLRVATYNVENLSQASGPDAFQDIAEQIVTRLDSPDIIGVQEMQDDDGPECSGRPAADLNWHRLVVAIRDAAGAEYAWADVPPIDGADGGQPCGNIRVGLLWRTDTVSLERRGKPDAATGVALVARADGTAGGDHGEGGGGVQLVPNPGLVDPTHAAWDRSRKPLAAEFRWKGVPIHVIVNHFRSKGGDDPLFGSHQPRTEHSVPGRVAQAGVVADLVQQLFDAGNEHVVVLGDLNDFEFSDAVTRLKQVGLVDLVETLPEGERYTYLFNGNAQVLDHVLVSRSLAGEGTDFDVVHVNAEFVDQVSDHDPCVAALAVPGTR